MYSSKPAHKEARSPKSDFNRLLDDTRDLGLLFSFAGSSSSFSSLTKSFSSALTSSASEPDSENPNPSYAAVTIGSGLFSILLMF